MYSGPKYGTEYQNFDQKKFADKLKAMVCMILGCTMEQLEDNTYKETLLGPEWEQVNPIWVPVKEMEMMYQLYGDTNGTGIADYAKGLGYDLMAYTGGEVCYKNERRKKMTPRLMLQLLGTDCGRKIIHPDIWVNALLKDYHPEKTYLGHGDYKEYEPDWIISDVRFPNEANAIKEKGGILIRINRNKRTSDRWQEMFPAITVLDPDGWNRQNYQFSWFEEYISLEEYQQRVSHSTCRFDYSKMGKAKPNSYWPENFAHYFKPEEHESETALDTYQAFDAVIDNDGTVDQLTETAGRMLTHLKLL